MVIIGFIVLLTASVIVCNEEVKINTNPQQSDDKPDITSNRNNIQKLNLLAHTIENIISNIQNIFPSDNSDFNDIPHYNEPNDELIVLNNSTSNITNNNNSNSNNNNITTNESKSNVTQKTVICKLNAGGQPVEIVNGTQLIKILLSDANVTKDLPGECVLILFYAKFCTFSSMAAPHFNALSRAFPDVKLAAIDAMKYHIFNTQNGIVGVPTLLLFHNGRPLGKFNDTEYTLDLFSKFITKYTGIEPLEKSYVTSADFAGPVPSTPEKETDYFLGLSWLFILICAVYYFSKSMWWKWIVETVQNTWRDSEVHHAHAD